MILNFFQNDNVFVLERLCRAVLHTETDLSIMRWFRGAEFGEAVLANTRALCQQSLKLIGRGAGQGAESARWQLFTLALTSEISQGEYEFFIE